MSSDLLIFQLIPPGEELYCTSCGKRVSYEKGVVAFKCPNCGEAVIVRCNTCRRQSNEYVCPNCGFVGP